MHARLRPKDNCGCTADEFWFVVAMYAYAWTLHRARQG